MKDLTALYVHPRVQSTQLYWVNMKCELLQLETAKLCVYSVCLMSGMSPYRYNSNMLINQPPKEVVLVVAATSPAPAPLEAFTRTLYVVPGFKPSRVYSFCSAGTAWH